MATVMDPDGTVHGGDLLCVHGRVRPIQEAVSHPQSNSDGPRGCAHAHGTDLELVNPRVHARVQLLGCWFCSFGSTCETAHKCIFVGTHAHGQFIPFLAMRPRPRERPSPGSLLQAVRSTVKSGRVLLVDFPKCSSRDSNDLGQRHCDNRLCS